MERDFMGLNSKDPVVVKEEIVDEGCKDFGFTRPLSNKLSGFAHLMSLKCEEDERPPKNFGDPIMKQQFPNRNLASVIGTTGLSFNSKDSSTPAQLTIFYSGTVNVFNNITPEMAQAIMLLAGNGCAASKAAQSELHVQAPASNMPPSPTSVTSRPIDESNVAAANNDDINGSKSIGIKVEPPRMLASVRGSVAATAILSSAIPQARKASLARFLEKRKERAMNAAPYKKAAEYATPESHSGDGLTIGKETSGEI